MPGNLRQFVNNAKQIPMSKCISAAIYATYNRIWEEVVCRYIDWRERDKQILKGEILLPPACLRFHVDGNYDRSEFLRIGRQCCDDIKAVLSKNGRSLASGAKILDFGCGCGHTLRWFAEEHPQKYLYGTDMDKKAIDWCQKNIKGVTFDINKAEPPLNYSSETFDFIYAISVFTHFNEQYQFLWLEELKRLLKPGGILLITLAGRYVWGKLPFKIVKHIEKEGFYFNLCNLWSGIFPGWYQMAFHSQKYVSEYYSRNFSIIDYVPQGMNQHQDIVLLKNNTTYDKMKKTTITLLKNNNNKVV